jgi:hypothetical protein
MTTGFSVIRRCVLRRKRRDFAVSRKSGFLPITGNMYLHSNLAQLQGIGYDMKEERRVCSTRCLFQRHPVTL